MFFIPQSSYQVRNTKKKGRGVFATGSIKAGTIIGDYLGKLTPYHEVDTADYPFLMYCNDEAGIVADKNKVGVHLLNHSCDPNCSMHLFDRHMLFVAIKDIKTNEELTISYMFPPQDSCENCAHECFCGSLDCIKTMHTPKEKYLKNLSLRA